MPQSKSEFVWSTCGHDPQTERFGVRCSMCHVDAITLRNETLLWPAQTDPMEFTGEQIAAWFYGNGIHNLNQGCDGFTFARNNRMPGKSVYGYVWVELVLDLDLEMAWMLDVRRHDGTNEHRQFLFVGNRFASPALTVEWHDHTALFGNDSASRGIHAMHWFADTAQTWIGAR